MNLEEKLNIIKVKVQRLLEQNSTLKSEAIMMNAEIEHLKELLIENEKRIQELENKNVNLHLTKTVESNDKNKIKSVIEELIAEIDKGLELVKSGNLE